MGHKVSLILFCFVCHLEPHKYQLWAYIYQARDLLAMDESGMNGEILLARGLKLTRGHFNFA